MMSKNFKKILVAGASLLMMASIGVGASSLTNPAHAESNQSADNTLNRVLYSHHYRQGHMHSYSPNPVILVNVHGHHFVYSYINNGVIVNGRKVSYKRGLSLYKRYNHSHRTHKIRKHHARHHARHHSHRHGHRRH